METDVRNRSSVKMLLR